MASTAFLIGNANYLFQPVLTCCLEDVAAMKALVEATGRYDSVHNLTDISADEMREALRDTFLPESLHREIFFYFSGHGARFGNEFYYCGVDFDPKRPNETGLSHADLHEILRPANPSLLVKIIDACFSGTPLIKADRQPLPLKGEGFSHVFQFSSSLDDQTSRAGEPLSEFTLAFLKASVRRTEGIVYYSDIENTLRDDFANDDNQTPFFVSQGTKRDILVDDASKLGEFRKQLETRWSASKELAADEDDDATTTSIVTRSLTPKDLLAAAEKRMGGPQEADDLAGRLFDGVLERFRSGDFGDLFECTSIVHRNYYESTTRDFMISVLSKKVRPDRFVTAERKLDKKTSDPVFFATHAIAESLSPNWTEFYKLDLNCELEKAQFRITMKPNVRSLQQLVLVLSIAPSLSHCYLFEMVTQHLRLNWDTFDTDGQAIVRRWYELDWHQRLDSLIEKISVALENVVRKHIDEATNKLLDLK